MATRLDQEIEQLENIVEKCLDLCKAMWNGIRCTLPANHERTEPHKFPVKFLNRPKLQRAIGKATLYIHIGQRQLARPLDITIDAPNLSEDK